MIRRPPDFSENPHVEQRPVSERPAPATPTGLTPARQTELLGRGVRKRFADMTPEERGAIGRRLNAARIAKRREPPT